MLFPGPHVAVLECGCRTSMLPPWLVPVACGQHPGSLATATALAALSSASLLIDLGSRSYAAFCLSNASCAVLRVASVARLGLGNLKRFRSRLCVQLIQQGGRRVGLRFLLLHGCFLNGIVQTRSGAPFLTCCPSATRIRLTVPGTSG